MSGSRILIVESNPLDLIAALGCRAVDQFKVAFRALVPSLNCPVAELYTTNFSVRLLHNVKQLERKLNVL